MSKSSCAIRDPLRVKVRDDPHDRTHILNPTPPPTPNAEDILKVIAQKLA